MKTTIGLVSRAAFALALGASCVSYSQEFQVPESVAFDPLTHRYFVSNYRGGSIIQIDSTGSKSYFQRGLSKPLGMILLENTLYVVDNPKIIRGFDITDGSPTLEIHIPEAMFLNDITSDESGFLYVTDSNAKAVFTISIAAHTYSVLARTESNGPNGVTYDRANNRLLVCYFKEKPPIDEIRLGDTTISTLGVCLSNRVD